jgi:hypothetical protein
VPVNRIIRNTVAGTDLQDSDGVAAGFVVCQNKVNRRQSDGWQPPANIEGNQLQKVLEKKVQSTAHDFDIRSSASRLSTIYHLLFAPQVFQKDWLARYCGLAIGFHSAVGLGSNDLQVELDRGSSIAMDLRNC